MNQLKYLFIGAYFGALIVKSEALSWFRVQEMFRFQSIHMFGIFGLAILVGLITVQFIKRRNLKTFRKEPIVLGPKALMPKAQIIGGLLFGIGWALTGLCVAPIFSLMGTGALAGVLIFIGALAGVWMYGLMRKQLPH